MEHSTLRRNLVFVAGWALAGFAIAMAVNWLMPRDNSPVVVTSPASHPAPQPATPTPPEAAAPEAGNHVNTPGPADAETSPPPPTSSYAPAVRASAPAVVSVYTQTKVNVGNNLQRTPSGRWVVVPKEALQPGLGSGVIVDTQGHIITNEHVITITDERSKAKKNVDEIFVQLADGRIAAASVVGTDPGTDLAVLKIELAGLPVMPLGRADRVAVGDTVLAIGSPLGLTQTVTHGIVSAMGRAQVGLAVYENFIQTDAAINHGNSGGALVNARGELIGINTAVIKDQGAEGLGMAIPVDLVRGVMREILQHGRVVRGWLGLALADVSDDYARQNNLPHGGVLIGRMHPASPVSLAGLATYDKIETLDGNPVRTGQDMMDRIVKTRPGAAVTITGVRARTGQPFSIEVRVIEAPEGSQ
jgi:serine protease DegS